MTPQQRWVGANTKEKAETLYVKLGEELVSDPIKYPPARDSEWRQEATRVRREIEKEYGPQGRSTWTRRKHVTIPKPGIRKPDLVTLVLHEDATGEARKTRTLDQLGLPEATQAFVVQALKGEGVSRADPFAPAKREFESLLRKLSTDLAAKRMGDRAATELIDKQLLEAKKYLLAAMAKK
jgi:hypothetical protein